MALILQVRLGASEFGKYLLISFMSLWHSLPDSLKYVCANPAVAGGLSSRLVCRASSNFVCWITMLKW